MRATCPAHFVFLYHNIYIWQGVRVMKLLIM
jgi:hypothetical protein